MHPKFPKLQVSFPLAFSKVGTPQDALQLCPHTSSYQVALLDKSAKMWVRDPWAKVASQSLDAYPVLHCLHICAPLPPPES